MLPRIRTQRLRLLLLLLLQTFLLPQEGRAALAGQLVESVREVALVATRTAPVLVCVGRNCVSLEKRGDLSLGAPSTTARTSSASSARGGTCCATASRLPP